MAKFKDFDAYFSEAKKEPVVLRYQGELHHLPASIPVATALMLRRLEKTGGNVGDETIIKLFISVFGQERYSKWVTGGMLIDQMIELLAWAMEAYGMASQKAENEGEAEAPLAEAPATSEPR